MSTDKNTPGSSHGTISLAYRLGSGHPTFLSGVLLGIPTNIVTTALFDRTLGGVYLTLVFGGCLLMYAGTYCLWLLGMCLTRIENRQAEIRGGIAAGDPMYESTRSDQIPEKARTEVDPKRVAVRWFYLAVLMGVVGIVAVGAGAFLKGAADPCPR